MKTSKAKIYYDFVIGTHLLIEPLHVRDITGLLCIEIDNTTDLKNTEELFRKNGSTGR